MTDDRQSIIVHKNRKRAFWALVIIAFFVPISGWLIYMGLQPGRPDVGWSLILFGGLGLVTFLASAYLILRTVRAPWHLRLTPEHFCLYTPTYDLKVPWARIVGIGVDEVNRREGCVLLFDDLPAIAGSARFHEPEKRPDAIRNAETMQARMNENYEAWGYHLALPGRILEMGPDELAALLSRARTGELWQNGEGQE